MVANSSDEEGSDDDASEEVTATMPGPAARACVRGHALTPVITKPADYAKLKGSTGNCDLCDTDFKYSDGAYHCFRCANWDCCEACGSIAVPCSDSGKKRRKDVR